MPYAADQAFNVRILPWRAVCGYFFLDAHILDPLAEELAIDRIPIADQKSRRCLFRECLDDLLSRPLGCRIRCDFEMDDFAAAMPDNAVAAGLDRRPIAVAINIIETAG